MNLSCGSKTIKYLMFVFNLFFVISGIIIIGVGTAAKSFYTEYSDILDSQYFTLPNMLIATGAFIFMISFFGCCGAFKESWIMLAFFSALLCVIFIFEFASGIAGYVLRGKTYNYLETTLRKDLLRYNETYGAWDVIQKNFECCGVDSSADWADVFHNNSLPISCCPAVSGTVGEFYCISNTTTTRIRRDTAILNVTQNGYIATFNATQNVAVAAVEPSSTSTPFSQGCKSGFGSYIEKHAVQIGGCALALALIQILGIVFSCHLVRQLKNGYAST